MKSIYSKEIEDAVAEIDSLAAQGKMGDAYLKISRGYHSGQAHIWLEAMRLHKVRKFNNESK